MRSLMHRGAVMAAGVGLLAAGMVAAVPGAAGAAVVTVTGVKAPLPANAAPDPVASVNSVSCGSAGNCTAVGLYLGRPIRPHGLLLTQTSGHWTAAEAPLPANARSDLSADLLSVSCASAGNCTAVGAYTDSSTNQQGLLLTQTSGHWTAAEAPVPPGAASDPLADPNSVSCGSAGNCTAVGDYLGSPGHRQGLLLTQTSGSWAAAQAPLPAGAAAARAFAFLPSVSCASAGNCTAVGAYDDRMRHRQGVLLTQTSGMWATGVKAPLPAGASTHSGVALSSVSCASAGNCTAVGDYRDSAGHQQGLLVTRKTG